MVESEPHKFLLPPVADMRYNWVELRVAVLDIDEMTELVTDAWTMVVPKHVLRSTSTLSALDATSERAQ